MHLLLFFLIYIIKFVFIIALIRIFHRKVIAFFATQNNNDNAAADLVRYSRPVANLNQDKTHRFRSLLDKMHLVLLLLPYQKLIRCSTIDLSQIFSQNVNIFVHMAIV